MTQMEKVNFFTADFKVPRLAFISVFTISYGMQFIRFLFALD